MTNSHSTFDRQPVVERGIVLVVYSGSQNSNFFRRDEHERTGVADVIVFLLAFSV